MAASSAGEYRGKSTGGSLKHTVRLSTGTAAGCYVATGVGEPVLDHLVSDHERRAYPGFVHQSCGSR